MNLFCRDAFPLEAKSNIVISALLLPLSAGPTFEGKLNTAFIFPLQESWQDNGTTRATAS